MPENPYKSPEAELPGGLGSLRRIVIGAVYGAVIGLLGFNLGVAAVVGYFAITTGVTDIIWGDLLLVQPFMAITHAVVGAILSTILTISRRRKSSD